MEPAPSAEHAFFWVVVQSLTQIETLHKHVSQALELLLKPIDYQILVLSKLLTCKNHPDARRGGLGFEVLLHIKEFFYEKPRMDIRNSGDRHDLLGWLRKQQER